jgi:post-segregation antitoxin (ccd killing protein)
MPRLQVYLPDDLHKALKKLGLPASELLQQAVRTELHQRKLRAASKKYWADVEKEVGEPTAADHAWAAELATRIAGRRQRAAG